jgi:hypothetical protein
VNPKLTPHLGASLFKSFLRVVAGYGLLIGHPITAGAFLIAAELFGVVEELV